MTPGEFIAKWRASELKKRSATQEYRIELCRRHGDLGDPEWETVDVGGPDRRHRRHLSPQLPARSVARRARSPDRVTVDTARHDANSAPIIT